MALKGQADHVCMQAFDLCEYTVISVCLRNLQLFSLADSFTQEAKKDCTPGKI